MEILKLENIVKSFGENRVLNGVDLSFEEGKISPEALRFLGMPSNIAANVRQKICGLLWYYDV